MPRGTESPSISPACCGSGASGGTLTLIDGAAVSYPLTDTVVFNDGFVLTDNGGGEVEVAPVGYSSLVEGRLTLESGVPNSSSDQTAKTNLYFTPYNGNRISLYNGTNWLNYTFAELTESLAGLAADSNYDVFAYLNAGNVDIELLVWTNSTTRATALVLQNGVYVKSGDTSRKYLGTIRTTNTIGQCEDSLLKRYVFNYFNRVPRQLYVRETTNTWTQGVSANWRQANSAAGNKVELVIGVNDLNIDGTVLGIGGGSGAAGSVGIGLNSVTVNSCQLVPSYGGAQNASAPGKYIGRLPTIGYNYLAWIELSRTSTMTWYGDGGVDGLQAGLMILVNL